MVQIVALSCSFGLGVCFSLLGTISVKLMPRLKIDQARFGTLVTGFMSACLIASLLMGVIIDRLGHRPVAVFGFGLAALCILLLARSKTYATVLGSCLLLGFGAMALNTAANTLIPKVLYGGQNAAAALNLGNVAFGVGLLLAPLVMSYLFRKTSYENTVSAVALVMAAPLVLAALATYPSQAGDAFEFGEALSLLAKPIVWVAGLALYCYSALDVSFSNWLPAFGKEVLAVSPRRTDPNAADAAAQRLISVYALALIGGRAAASQMPGLKEFGYWYVAATALAVALLILCMTWTRHAVVAWLLVLLVGALTAPFFPLIVATSFGKFPEEVHGSLFGIIFAGALAGGATVPKAIGNLAKGSSIRKSMGLLAPLCVALAILAYVLGTL